MDKKTAAYVFKIYSYDGQSFKYQTEESNNESSDKNPFRSSITKKDDLPQSKPPSYWRTVISKTIGIRQDSAIRKTEREEMLEQKGMDKKLKDSLCERSHRTHFSRADNFEDSNPNIFCDKPDHKPVKSQYRSHFIRQDDYEYSLNCKPKVFYDKSELILHGSNSQSQTKPSDWEAISSRMPGIYRESTIRKTEREEMLEQKGMDKKLKDSLCERSHRTHFSRADNFEDSNPNIFCDKPDHKPVKSQYRSHFIRQDDYEYSLNCKPKVFYDKSELILHGSNSQSQTKPSDWEAISSRMPGIYRESNYVGTKAECHKLPHMDKEEIEPVFGRYSDSGEYLADRLKDLNPYKEEETVNNEDCKRLKRRHRTHFTRYDVYDI